MTYLEGFVLAVPAANKQAFRDHAAAAAPLFRELGATRILEAWGDDVPDGKINDFKTAVKANSDEVVVFSWLEYPDRATRDAANQRMQTDPRMAAMGDAPFDGMRMIFAGFEPMVDEGAGGKAGYVDGYLVPVTPANREAYRAKAEKTAALFRDHGATRVVEAWGDDVSDGKVTDYRRAVLAKDGEEVVYSFVEWPSKDARTAGWEKIMVDERMKPDGSTMPFDGARMIWGGFSPIIDA
jgi:uncharacterized protein YbaA (DUF1428 family)